MKTTQGKLLAALDHVERFLERNGETMGDVITSVAHQNFSACRTRMSEHVTAQNEHKRGIIDTVGAKRALRNRLIRRHMRLIAIIARAKLPDVEQFGALTVPPGNQQVAELVASALGMARAAKAHEATFVAAGLPADFIEKLVAAAESLKAGMTSKGEASVARVRATSGLKEEARIARTNLRLIDGAVRASVEDRKVLDEWRAIRRAAAAATSPKAIEELPGSGEAPAAA